MTSTRSSLFAAMFAGGVALVLTACAGDRPTAPALTPNGALSFERAAAPSSTSPGLLACPVDTSASASAVIGPRGGTLSVGKFSIRIPKRAVSAPTLFTFSVPASSYLEVDISAENVEHFYFERPVEVTLDYSRCNDNLDLSSLDAWYIERGTRRRLSAMRGHNALGREEFIFSTWHLSGYALADRYSIGGGR